MAIPTIDSIYVPSPAKVVKVKQITALEKLYTIELPKSDRSHVVL